MTALQVCTRFPPLTAETNGSVENKQKHRFKCCVCVCFSGKKYVTTWNKIILKLLLRVVLCVTHFSTPVRAEPFSRDIFNVNSAQANQNKSLQASSSLSRGGRGTSYQYGYLFLCPASPVCGPAAGRGGTSGCNAQR